MVDWIKHFRAATCAMPVSHIWRGYGSSLFVEFGKLAPSSQVRRDGSNHNPRGEVSLMVEWSWRVEDERSIICGSWSDERLLAPSFARLIGQSVLDLTTFGHLPEVTIALSGDLHITSFMTAEGDPSWALLDWRGATPITVVCRSGMVQEGEQQQPPMEHTS